mmetsp:Transcript_11111/g.30384  ORF Transcript_11111/g.30384 Transcript_11111/m.30384 type:complete len:262 (+) Transcript_11111:288-1073(+)
MNVLQVAQEGAAFFVAGRGQEVQLVHGEVWSADGCGQRVLAFLAVDPEVGAPTDQHVHEAGASPTRDDVQRREPEQVLSIRVSLVCQQPLRGILPLEPHSVVNRRIVILVLFCLRLHVQDLAPRFLLRRLPVASRGQLCLQQRLQDRHQVHARGVMHRLHRTLAVPGWRIQVGSRRQHPTYDLRNILREVLGAPWVTLLVCVRNYAGAIVYGGKQRASVDKAVLVPQDAFHHLPRVDVRRQRPAIPLPHLIQGRPDCFRLG